MQNFCSLILSGCDDDDDDKNADEDNDNNDESTEIPLFSKFARLKWKKRVEWRWRCGLGQRALVAVAKRINLIITLLG